MIWLPANIPLEVVTFAVDLELGGLVTSDSGSLRWRPGWGNWTEDIFIPKNGGVRIEIFALNPGRAETRRLKLRE